MLKIVGDEYREYGTRAKTSVSAVGLADIACRGTSALVSAWKSWKGWHAMPSYSAWAEADLGRDLEHASVARVVDGGQDYEFEFIGDAHVRAYGINHQGRRVSDIARLSPRFGKQLKASYDLVRISGHPHAFQGEIGAEDSSARFVWFETAYLPLGAPGAVECILNAAVYQLREAA